MGSGGELRPPRPQQAVEVMRGEWRSLQDEGRIFTRRMATCIGVSVYDRVEKRAILGHFDDVALSDGVFDVMMQAAVDSFPATQQTRVWVGGGTLLEPELAVSRDADIDAEIVEIANRETELFRERVLNSVDRLVSEGAALSSFWLRGAVYIDYSLDVGTGEEQVTISED